MVFLNTKSSVDCLVKELLHFIAVHMHHKFAAWTMEYVQVIIYGDINGFYYVMFLHVVSLPIYAATLQTPKLQFPCSLMSLQNLE